MLRTKRTFLSSILVSPFAFSRGAAGRTAEPPQAGGGAGEIDAAKFPSLQAALDAVPETGGVVRLPPGEFKLTRPLVLSRERTRLTGSGDATQLLNVNESGEPAILIRHPKRASDAKARLWGIQLEGFRISGNPKSGDGLFIEGVNEIVLRSLTIERHGGHGIHLYDGYENPRLVHMNITYNGKAGLNIIRGHDLVVSANQFEENQDAVRCIDSYNLTLTGNNIDDHLRDGVVIENTYGSVVSGNMIEECAGAAMVLDRNCYGITMSANVIAHNWNGIQLRDAWGCTVSANTFTIVAERALFIGPGAGRITVTGNNFSNDYLGNGERKRSRPEGKWPEITRATGLMLEGTSDIAVVGNVFSGLADRAVSATGECRRVTVVGNVVSDIGRRGEEPVTAFELGTVQEKVAGLNAVEKKFEGK
jgi:parallel beta-helix repeat protein